MLHHQSTPRSAAARGRTQRREGNSASQHDVLGALFYKSAHHQLAHAGSGQHGLVGGQQVVDNERTQLT
jgi:hypothetical protein